MIDIKKFGIVLECENCGFSFIASFNNEYNLFQDHESENLKYYNVEEIIDLECKLCLGKAFIIDRRYPIIEYY